MIFFMFMMYFKNFTLDNLFPSEADAISVKYIKRLIPKLIFPAFKIGIFLEYFLIKFSSFFSETSCSYNNFFFNFDAIFKTSNVHLGIVKSIITSAFLKAFSSFKLIFIPLIFLLINLFSVRTVM